MSVNWTLKDASNNNLAHQPSSGSPLSLKFNNSGEAHLSGYATEIINTVEVFADTSSVTIMLTADNSGYVLDESESRATETPSAHSGALTWTDSSGTTSLEFTVPGSVGISWDWSFGGLETSIALKLKVKVKRQ
jgi:hypothetical protein